MARPKGILKLEGSVGELSFYNSVYGEIVRRKGGASKEKIKKSKAFVNLRRHHAEFSDCAAAGKLFRTPLRLFSQEAPDHRLVWRVTKLMNLIKDEDKDSLWGERSVLKGLATEAGKNLLIGFDFNSVAPLANILKTKYKTQKDQIEIKALHAKDLIAPKGATHVTLTGIFTAFDLEKKSHTVQKDSQTFKLDKTKRDVMLKSPTATKTKGFAISLLQIQFSQEANSASYALHDKAGNGLGVVGVE